MLSNAGDHVPDIAGVFVEVIGKVNVVPVHIAGTCVNVVIVFGVTVTVIEAVVAQTPVVGVKV